MKHYAKLLALVLTLSMLAGVILSVSAGTAIDPDRKCSVTIGPANFEELKEIDIEVDLYRVASVDAYAQFTALPGFESLDFSPKQEGDEKWQSEEQKAIELIAAEDSTIVPTTTATIHHGTDRVYDMETGVYLALAHLPGAEKKDYIIRSEEDGKLYTYMETPEFAYTIVPTMISLPGSEDGMTSSDNWEYDRIFSLKMDQKNRFGDLIIRKTLNTYSEIQGDVTFVFDIQATLDGKLVYSNVEALIFDGPGPREIRVSHLPAGAEVTVTEVYSGASYKLTSDPTQTATIIAEGMEGYPVSVSFTNDYDEKIEGGHGVINKFSHDGEKWNWEQDETPAPRP